MGLWVAGVFLLGAGAGALTTFVLNSKQIRQLKELLETERNSQTKQPEQRHETDGRKFAYRRSSQ